MRETSKPEASSKLSRLRRYKGSWLPAALWRLVAGNPPFVFATGVVRALIEALLIATLYFGVAANNVLISDYRLVWLAYLPGAGLSLIWTALRLRRLVNPQLKGWQYVAKVSGWNAGFGLMLGGLLVAHYLLFSSLFYPVQNLSAPLLPSLFSPNELLSGAARAYLSFNWIISGPTQFEVTTSPTLIIALRVGTFALELLLVFLVARLGWGLLALPIQWLRRKAAKRLLWQLTLSHFSVVLASLTTALLSIAIFVIPIFSSNGMNAMSSARQLPAYEGRLIVETINAAEKGNNPLASNNLETLVQFLGQNDFLNGFSSPFSNKLPSQAQDLIRQLRNTSGLPGFIAVMGPGGQLIVTTNQQRFNAAMQTNQADLQQLLARSSAGETNLDRLVLEKVQPDLLIAGAYPFKTGQQATPLLSILVVEPPEVALTSSSRLLGVLLVAGVFFIVAIVIASFFTLFVALVFGYLVSRRLVYNLESLTGAANAIAGGNLERRVTLPLVQDEVGQLAGRFNYMAGRLQESQANLAQEKLVAEQALLAKRELVANVSHELRTPVSTIRAHVDWLLNSLEGETANRNQVVSRLINGATTDTVTLVQVASPSQDDLQQYLAIIERETRRLSDLIDDLLVLSQAEALSTTIQLEAVPIAELGQEIKQSLGLMAQRERKVTLTLDIAPDLPLVWADRTRLSQILINLVRNGINYTSTGGIVSIGAAMIPATRSVVIWVADTGIGISPDDLERIFERFYRSDASRSRHSGGAGLGLAIVKTLVEAMGGSLSVESVLEEGSKFSVILPVAA